LLGDGRMPDWGHPIVRVSAKVHAVCTDSPKSPHLSPGAVCERGFVHMSLGPPRSLDPLMLAVTGASLCHGFPLSRWGVCLKSEISLESST
jgi:hypothetical protein